MYFFVQYKNNGSQPILHIYLFICLFLSYIDLDLITIFPSVPIFNVLDIDRKKGL